jgi:hypothetical protein
MKIVYSHNREYKEHATYGVSVSPRGGSTVAMESIQSWLLTQLQQGDTIVRKVGIARCSEDDNYCKKTGRELALSRMKSQTLTAVNIVKMGNVVTVFFEDQNDNLFEVKTSKDVDCAILVRMLED